MTRLLPLAILAALLTGCGTLTPPQPLPPPPTLAAADTLARGRIGQIVRVDGGTLVGVRFTGIAADSVRGAQGPRPLAVATREVREVVLLGDPAPDARPVLAGAFCASPYVVGAAERIVRGPENASCVETDQPAVAVLGAGVLAGALGYFVSKQFFPDWPRTDLIIPLTPLSRFADAPRTGVGLWRQRR